MLISDNLSLVKYQTFSNAHVIFKYYRIIPFPLVYLTLAPKHCLNHLKKCQRLLQNSQTLCNFNFLHPNTKTHLPISSIKNISPQYLILISLPMICCHANKLNRKTLYCQETRE